MRVKWGELTFNFSTMERYETEEPQKGFRTFVKLFVKNGILMQALYNGPCSVPREIQEAYVKYSFNKIEKLLLE